MGAWLIQRQVNMAGRTDDTRPRQGVPPLAAVAFKFNKKTPRTLRYKEIVEQGQEPIIGFVYIKQSALQQRVPDGIQVTVTELSGRTMRALRAAHKASCMRVT